MPPRKKKVNGVTKLQKPALDQNLKAKFDLAKTQTIDQCVPSTSHPSSSTSLPLNKQIDNNNMTTNLTQNLKSRNQKRRNQKKNTVPNVSQPEKDSKDNVSTNRPLNIHQKKVLEKCLNKSEGNKVDLVKNDCNEAKKGNLNVHQLKVLEKLEQKFKQHVQNQRKQCKDLNTTPIPNVHNNASIKNVATPQLKTANNSTSIKKTKVPVCPTPKAGKTETPVVNNIPRNDNKYTSISHSTAPTDPNSAEKRLQELRKRWTNQDNAVSKNSGYGKTSLVSEIGVPTKTSPRSKTPNSVQPSSGSKTPVRAQTWASKTPVSVQSPSGSKTPFAAQTWASKTPVSVQSPSGSKTPVAAQTWASKTPVSVQSLSGSKTPVAAQTWASKTPISVQSPSESKTLVATQTWASKTPVSVQSPSGSKTPVAAQTWASKTPISVQSPSESKTLVAAQTWASKTPVSVQSPSGSKTPVAAQTWASKTPVSVQTPSGSRTPVPAQFWESKTPVSIQKPSGSIIPVPAQTLKAKQSKNETGVGGSQSNEKTMQYSRRRCSHRKSVNISKESRPLFEQVSPDTRLDCVDSRVAGMGSAEARLKNFRKRLSESDPETPKVSSQSKQLARNLLNEVPMTVDDQVCKRRSESDYANTNKRKKVESLAQQNMNNESVSANNIFDTSNNVLDTSKNIFDTSKNNNVSSFLPENTSFNSPNVTDQSKIFEEEDMDWETVAEQIKQVRGGLQNSTSNSSVKLFDNKTIEKSVSNSSKPIFVVVDTNIFILHLSTVEKLTDSTKKGIGCEICVMVPYIVLCELDKLKLYMHGKFANTQAMARKAMRYLHNNLTSNPKICGQSAKSANEHLFPCPVADDEILNCCLQLSEAGETVVLLTNDINLCNKAAVNKINMFTHKQFIVEFFQSLNSTTVSSTHSAIINENISPSAKIQQDLCHVNNCRELNLTAEVTHVSNEEKQMIVHNTAGEKFKCMEDLLRQFLLVPLEEEMKDKFGILWTKVVLVEPPWTLSDILKCLVKHWIAVFSDILLRDVQSVIKDLQIFFPPTNNARRCDTYSEANLKVIYSLSVKLVEHFKLNRKYSQSAQKCIQDIQNVFTDTFDKSRTNNLDNNTISTTDEIQENKSEPFWKDNSREDDFWNENSPKVTNKMMSSIIKPCDVFKNENYSSPKEIIQNTQTILGRVNSNQMVPKNTLEAINAFNGSRSLNEIVEILKLILQGLCKFCADLANALQVSHSLNVVSEKAIPLLELVTQATPVGNQLQLIVNCMSRMLSSLSLESLPLQQRQQESILASVALSNILNDTFFGMGHTSLKLDSNDVLVFCTMHRNLLEEAYTDFLILHNLIMECSQKYAATQT